MAEDGVRAAGDLEVHACDRLADVPLAEWDALSARAPASLSGSRAWIEAALATVDRDLTPHLLLAQAGGRMVGLMPLVLDERSERPLLRFAAAPFNDLADLLVLPGHEMAAAQASINTLRAMSADGLSVSLEDLDPAGALAGADPDRRLLSWEPGCGAPTIDLRDADASASARLHRRWDRSLQRLRATHRVEFRFRGGAPAVEALGEFMQQRERRLRALKRSLCLPPSSLLEAAVNRLAPLGKCGFMEMQVDGTAVARDLYLVDRAVAMLWLRSLDMEWLEYNCGHLLLRASSEHLAAQGYETLDLGRGDERYKFDFGARKRVLLKATLSGCN